MPEIKGVYILCNLAMLNEIFLRNKKSTMLNTLKALCVLYVYLYLAYKAQFQNIPFM